MAINPQEPAFPVPDEPSGVYFSGITVHQYFAAKAMQALFTAAAMLQSQGYIDKQTIAEEAKAMADKMCEVLD